MSPPMGEALSLFSLEGRVAVVTGAGSGIGQRISIGFAGAGATVVLVDIDEQGLDDTAQMIRAVSPGNPSVPAKCDVSSEDQVLSLFDRVRRQPGRIDVLVNGAFTPTFGRPQAVGLDLWERAIKVNLTGYFLCARSAGQAMIDAGRGGSIINISSIAGVSGMGRGNFAYSVTKGGVVQMTRELAVEWGRYGIPRQCHIARADEDEGLPGSSRPPRNGCRRLDGEAPQSDTSREDRRARRFCGPGALPGVRRFRHGLRHAVACRRGQPGHELWRPCGRIAEPS